MGDGGEVGVEGGAYLGVRGAGGDDAHRGEGVQSGCPGHLSDGLDDVPREAVEGCGPVGGVAAGHGVTVLGMVPRFARA